MSESKTQAGGKRMPRHDHERSDINIRGVIFFAASLVIGAVMVHVLVLGVFAYLSRREAAADPALHPLVKTEKADPEQVVKRFPEPRLQPDDVRDMNELRYAEQLRLKNYTWVDEKEGKVRIPIERAMEVIAERGLPMTANASGERVPPATAKAVEPSRDSSHTSKVGGGRVKQ